MAVRVLVNPNASDKDWILAFEHDRLVMIDLEISYSDGTRRTMTVYIHGDAIKPGLVNSTINVNVTEPERV